MAAFTETVLFSDIHPWLSVDARTETSIRRVFREWRKAAPSATDADDMMHAWSDFNNDNKLRAKFEHLQPAGETNAQWPSLGFGKITVCIYNVCACAFVFMGTSVSTLRIQLLTHSRL